MHMKTFKLVLTGIIAILFYTLNAQEKNTDPVVMKIGTENICLSEFEYAYRKNHTIEAVEKVSFEQYINMFKDYKLKVYEARKLGFDQSENYKRELAVYKTILDIEKENGELTQTEYNHLLKEYEEGILLFEISNQKVWDKGNRDLKGLVRYFMRHKSDYKLKEAHFKGCIVECKNEKIAQEVKQLIKYSGIDSIKSFVDQQYNKTSIQVRINRVFVKRGDNKHVDKAIFEREGFIPDPQYPFMNIEGRLISDYPESYKDIRGQVATDYQNHLDQLWIKELNKKYKVIVYHNIIKTVKED